MRFKSELLSWMTLSVLLGCASSKKMEEAKVTDKSEASTEARLLMAEQKNFDTKKTKKRGPASGDEAFEMKPVTISFSQVASDLGMSEARLEKQIRILANFMDTKSMPANLCEDDDENTEKLCDLLGRLQSTQWLTNGARVSASASGGRRVPIRPHHFPAQQAMGYERLMKSIHKESAQRILMWSPKLLASTACPRNLSAVAIRKLESLLPSPNAKSMMEKLYDHAAACLSPEDDGFESMHFRQALLRYNWGDKAGARKAINRAVVAKQSDERARVLYWAGLLQTDTKVQTLHWNRLVEEHPLSFHALEVWQKLNIDPMKIFNNRPPLALNRKGLDADSDIDTGLRWLESLYLIGRVEAAQKLSRWVARVYKDELTPQNLLYMSLLKSSRGTPLNTITFLTRQVSENPAILNRQTLTILFPRHYLDTFERVSSSTDAFLLLAVARQESGFNPKARSRANARGLLQLLPATARRISGMRRPNLYNSELNATLGAKFLAQLIDQFESVELALAAYNAGPGRIPEWKGRYGDKDLALFLDLIPFKETRNYVSSILRNNYWYERLYRDDPTLRKDKHSEVVNRLVSAHSGSEHILGIRRPASENL